MAAKKYYWQTACIIALTFIVMYTLNLWMPIHRDDYEYSLIWNTTTHIASWSDVFTSLYRHYLYHGGRMVTVFVLDSLLLLGKPLFDFCNAAIFVGLVVLLYFHACRSTKLWAEPKILGVIAFFAWLSFPHFGEVAIWKSGSTVYLWSAFIVFLFLLPYNLFFAQPTRRTPLFAVVMFILGILAGWSVENFAVTAVAITVLSSCYAYRYLRNMPLWLPAGALGAFLGFVGMLAAPGNYVRYDQQGSGKGIFIHLGNQIAGNGEMLLYILPMVLLTFLMWRVLKKKLAGGLVAFAPTTGFAQGRVIMVLVIVALVYSYFNGGFIAASIRDFLIANVLTPLNLVKKNTVHLFSNVMAGFEEMAIYWLCIFFFYSLLKAKLGLTSEYLRQLNSRVKAKQVWDKYPAIHYSAFLFVLALFNNFVMIAAPTFPARATFSSVAIIIIGVAALLRMPELRQVFLQGVAARGLCLGGATIGLFTVVAALVIMHSMMLENDIRLAFIHKEAAHQVQVVTLPPITLMNRALRHVYFEDFSNNVTKEGLCRFVKIKDIKVQAGAPLE